MKKNNLYKYLLFFIVSITINKVSSQEFSAKVEYTRILNEEEFKKHNTTDPNMDPVMKKFIEDKIKEKLQKKFLLTLNLNESIYDESQIVNIKNEDMDNSWSPYGLDLKIFKNLKNKKVIFQKDLMSKLFYIQDSLPELEWEILDETKMIGKYNCKKAIVKIHPTQFELDEYENEIKENNNKTNFFPLKKPEDKIITVWFTPKIPINNGPDIYWGLPGLILEINDSKYSIQCTKISINNEKLSINFPKKSKILSVDEYNKIVEVKLQEIENTN